MKLIGKKLGNLSSSWSFKISIMEVFESRMESFCFQFRILDSIADFRVLKRLINRQYVIPK